jgi:two-component system response regulator DesR
MRLESFCCTVESAKRKERGKPMRILIADNQHKVRFALRVALEQQPGFKTIGEAIDAQDLIAQAKAICPDLAIIDWGLPDLPPADLIRTLRDLCYCVRVIVLSSRMETRDQALAAGANVFVSMCNTPDELLSAIETCFADATN